MKRYPLILILLLIIARTAWADFNDGVVAYLMGDYDRAYQTMRSLADTADHAYAQYYVGMMFLQGQGVEQDYEEAGSWFRKAAEQSIPQAQFNLGNLYLNGQGLPRDFEYAYAWFRVGASHNHKKSLDALDATRGQLSETELEEADKLAEDLITRYGPKEGSEAPRHIDNE